MTIHNDKLTKREELVQTVKDLGQSVIEMVEDIVGDTNYLSDLDITLRCEVVSGYGPSIDISKTYAPPAYIRRLAGEKDSK